MFTKILFTYLFLEKGEGREKERERNIPRLPPASPPTGTWPAIQACALTGNQPNLQDGRTTPNPLGHTTQSHTVVLICILLVADDIKHLFTYSLSIYILSLLKSPSKFLAHFSLAFSFWVLIYTSYYITLCCYM